MTYRWIYKTPDGFEDLLLISDGEFLTALLFLHTAAAEEHREGQEENLPVFRQTARWLDEYFSGRQPSFMPSYKILNLTPFRQEVIDIMLSVPFGETITYGGIAAKIAKAHGMKRMSAQAVGGAVGWNPLCILIPCHRVIGADGSLTGYGGGVANKVSLLKLEGHDLNDMIIPKGPDKWTVRNEG